MRICLALAAAFLLVAAAGDSNSYEAEFPITSFDGADVSGVTSQNGNIGTSSFSGGALAYDFRFQPGYVGVGLSTRPIPGIPYRFALTMETDSSYHPVVLRLRDATGQAFQRTLGIMDRPGKITWQVAFGPEEQWFHFGGDGDIHYPVRVAEVILDGMGTRDRGRVNLVGLQGLTRVTREEGLLLTVKPRTDSPHSFTVFWRNLLPMESEGTLEYAIRDVNGADVGSGSAPLKLAAHSSGHLALGAPARSAPVQAGSFDLRAMRTTTHVEATMINPVPFPRSRTLAPDSPFGMGIYFGNRYSPDEMHRAAELAMDAGMNWSREELSWSRIEPTKGSFSWDVYDRAVSVATAHGISLFGLLDYWAPWTKPYTPEGIDDYCEYVRRTVTRYKDRIHYWEIWNEPNIEPFWKGTPDQYADLLKAAAAICKQADPNSKVIAMCTAGTDLRFIEKVALRAGLENVDIVSVHPYRYPRAPEESNLVGELQGAAKALRRRGKPLPLWITEVGYPTHEGEKGSTPMRQAQMLVRTYLQSIASGVVEKVFWYDYRDDGEDPSYNEHNFGILHRDLSPKPAYAAFSVMTAVLEGLKFAEQIPLGRGVLAYRFESPDKSKAALVAWTVNGEQSVSLPAAAPVTVLDMSGARRSLRPRVGRVNVTLTGSPLFILGVS
jgi:hypothetical protein